MGRQSSFDGSGRDDARLSDLLDHMEAHLRPVEGTVSALRSLSETTGAHEPVALEAIAHLAGEVVKRITARSREASDVFRGP